MKYFEIVITRRSTYYLSPVKMLANCLINLSMNSASDKSIHFPESISMNKFFGKTSHLRIADNDGEGNNNAVDEKKGPRRPVRSVSVRTGH